MKLLAISMALVAIMAVSASQCHAQSLSNIGLKNHYRPSSGNTVRPKLTVQQFKGAWSSETRAVCVQGTSPQWQNKKFKDMGLKFRDCSESDAKRIEHADRGIKVYVIKKHQLPRELYGKKK